MKHRFDAAGGNLPSLPWRPLARAPLTAVTITTVVWAVLASTGCGPLGLYSFVHSELAHHHVFKPVVPGPSVNDGHGRLEHRSGHPAYTTGKKGSSRPSAMPKVITRRSQAKADDTNRAADGDGPCLD